MASGRRLITGFLVSLLFVVITLGVPLWALSSVATSREAMRQIVLNPATFRLIKNSALTLPLGEVGVDQQTAAEAEDVSSASIEPLIDRYFTEDFHGRLVTGVIDGIYDWLEGKTTRPEFEVRISDNPAEFKQVAVDGFVTRYQTLPACAPGTVFATEYNALEADCRVSSISVGQVRTAVEQQLSDSQLQTLFASATISSEEFLKNLNSTDLQQIQRIYRTLKLSQLLIIGAILTLGSLISLSVFDRHKGFTTLGKAILVPSLLAGLLGLVFRFFQPAIVSNLTPDPGGGAAVVNVARELANSFLIQINNRWLLISGILIGLAIGLLAFQHWLNRHGQPQSGLRANKPHSS